MTFEDKTMGMGYAANYADIVNQEFVKEQCKKQFNNFIQALDKADITLSEFAQNYESYEEQENPFKSFTNLCSEFTKKTGLGLYLGYHDQEDNGDRYDDVDGYFWCVDGVFQFTKAGKKYQKQISRKM